MITAPLVLGWISVIAGLAAALGVFLKIGPERKKITAEVQQAGVDAAARLSESAVALLQPSMDQVGFLRTELAAARIEGQQMREENAQLRAEQARLSHQIAALRAELAALRGDLAPT